MFAISVQMINERFDNVDKAIQALKEQQSTTEKKLEEIMASKVFKSKVIIK